MDDKNIDDKINLIDMGFQNLPVEEKRTAFIFMDVMLKKLHEKNLMVTSFDPRQIYYQNGFYTFASVSPITNYYAQNKEEAILKNILGLSNLAFCSYLSDYQLDQGLLSQEVISNHFSSFSNIFVDEDRPYYKEVLVNSYQSRRLPENHIYYSDYIIKHNQDNRSKGNNSLAYVKATEAGRAIANQDEAAFGHTFFLLTIVSSISVALIGFIILFSIYFV